jgi:succinyl-diaminopimelate desuccinylase
MGVLEEIVERTERLIAVQSIEERPEELRRVIDLLAEELTGLPSVRLHRIADAGYPALAVTFTDSKTAQLVFNAHVDVVPGRLEQFQAVVRDGRIYGRGAHDMKGAAAVYVTLIKELAALERPPSVAFQFVTDEEIGGYHGSLALIKHGFVGEIFIAGEPTDMRICNRAKGILWLRVKQAGVPAHGSRPWDGINPILLLKAGLDQLMTRYPLPAAPVWRTTVTPSAIAGGDAVNRVPVSCELKLDIRYIPVTSPDDVLAEVRAAFPAAEVELIHDGSALETSADYPLVQAIAQAQAQVTGEPVEFYDEHFGSDARFYGELNLPAVCWGPTGAGLHSDEEWVSIESLRTYHAALRRLVGLD